MQCVWRSQQPASFLDYQRSLLGYAPCWALLVAPSVIDIKSPHPVQPARIIITLPCGYSVWHTLGATHPEVDSNHITEHSAVAGTGEETGVAGGRFCASSPYGGRQ